MTEEDYKNREIDEKFRESFERMKHFDKDMRESNARIEASMANGFEQVNRRLDITNGKVKKIITALIALAAFSIGVGLNGSGNLLMLLKTIGI